MRKNLIAGILLSIIMVLGTGITAFAADDAGSGDSGDKGYDYKVFVYSGNQGTFKGVKEWSDTYESGGNVVTFNVNDVHVTNDQYVAVGFKIAGHDNDETDYSPQLTFNGGGDVSYVVTYRIPGAMVPYKANYVTTDGKSLGSDTFYGMVGDKPVVSFKYFKGYLPDTYSQGMTLKEDPAKNVFTFTYTKAGSSNDNPGGNGQEGDNGNNGNNGNRVNGIAANAPGTAGNPAGTNTANINDNATPLASPDIPQYVDQDEQGGVNWLWVLAIVLGVAAFLAALIALIMKRRKNGEDLDEELEDQINDMFK